MKAAMNYDPRPRSPRQPYSQLAGPGQNTRPNQVTAPQSKEVAAPPFHPTVRAATYYTGEYSAAPHSPLMPSKPLAIRPPQPSVSDPEKEERALYKSTSWPYALGPGKVLGEQKSEVEEEVRPVARSITMTSRDGCDDDYSPQVFNSKRRKPNEPEEDSPEEPFDDDVAEMTDTRPKKRAVKRKGKKKVLKPIVGMIGKPEVNVEAILYNTPITLPALHLFQISPFWRDETRRLIQAPRKPRRKKEKKEKAAEVFEGGLRIYGGG